MKEFNFTYFLIYAFFVFFALLFALKVDVRRKQAQTLGVLVSVFFVIALIVLFGFRDFKVGTDTLMYKYQFTYYKKIDFGAEFMINWLMSTLHLFTNDPRAYIFILSSIFLVVIFWASILFSRYFQYNVLFVFFSFISFYYFENLGINIVRQGIALAFLLVALGYYYRKPKSIVFWLIPTLLAIGFHLTSLVVILVFLLVIIFKRLHFIFYSIIYFAFVVLAFFKISILTFMGSFGKLFEGDRRNDYLNGAMDKEFSIGFKPQFVIFNTLFLLIFFLIRKYGQKQEHYDILLKTYIGISCIFFMMFQIPFSDRWGVMSWVLIPFLFAPVFAENGQYRTSIVSVLFLAIIFVIFQSMYYQS